MQAKRNRSPKRRPTGISERHSRSCRSQSGGACNCRPSYRAWVYDRRSGTKIRKTFPTLAAAKAWRADATSQLNRGRMVAPTRQSLRETAEAWVSGAEAEPPTILNRSGQPYKPSALRGYKADLNRYVLPELGATRLSELRRGDLQNLVERLLGRGLSASKVRNVVLPIRAIYRHALERDLVAVNPTSDLRLPNGIGHRERAASPTEAASLLAALPEDDRALWATAFYGGLRRGELRALRWSDVDLAAGIIRVSRGWDDMEGEITPKSRKGTRTVPITALLRDYLTEQKARTGRDGEQFVFGPAADRPFTPSYIRKRATRAWETANADRTKKNLDPLVPIGLHECRHTFVSLMHDAGLSLERIGDYVGHSSAYMTDRYRHLLEGHEAEAARLLDDYLARADSATRIAQIEADD
jgi:integrase